MGRWAIVNTVLVVIVLLLGLQIARTWSRSLPPVDLTVRAPEPAPRPEDRAEQTRTAGGRRGGRRAGTDKVELQPVALVATIVDKDLFDPSRQRATEEVAPPPPKELPPPPNLTLAGIRMIGKDREVLVTDVAQGGQQRRLRVGDEIGGYTVKAVYPSRVTLASASGDTLTLSLTIEKTGGGVPRPPGTPGVPPRPGQPAPGMAPSPAAGVQPPPPPAPAGGAGQPRLPRAARPGVAGAPGMPQAPVPPVPPVPQPPVAAPGTPPGVPPTGFANPNLPEAVRERLEQLKAN